MLKDNKKLEVGQERTLDVYLKQCSIEVDVVDLANIAAIIANNGISPYTKEKIIDKNMVRLIKGVMTVSGMYNESGEFLMNVGLPSKSGVSGGILSVASNNFGYMLIVVKPGIVLISLIYIFPLSLQIKKSTRASPAQSKAM